MYIPLIVFVLLFHNSINENAMNTTITNTSNGYIYDDYCNINESKAIYLMIQDIISYFGLNVPPSNNSTCLFLNEKFSQYSKYFISLDKSNKIGGQTLKCSICEKRFRSNSLLIVHYKLFHLNNSENDICHGDFCQSMNCERYKRFYGIKYIDNSNDLFMYNRQPTEKKQICNKELVPFYKDTCMKLVEGCFSNDENKLYTYYNNLCGKINCDISYHNQLQKESSFFDIIRLIFIYIAGILTFIYLLIIWLTKFS